MTPPEAARKRGQFGILGTIMRDNLLTFVDLSRVRARGCWDLLAFMNTSPPHKETQPPADGQELRSVYGLRQIYYTGRCAPCQKYARI